MKPVSEIAHRSLGKMLDKAKNKGTPRPYLRNVNVRWFNFDLSDLLEMRFLDEESTKFTAVKGDVLICEGGYPGRAAIWEENYPMYFQKAIHRVRFHEPERNRWFLYYLYFKETTGQLRQYYTGTGIQHFTGEALARLQIPLPPLPEQRRIVGILDEAFDGIATAKANAETLPDAGASAGYRWPSSASSPATCRLKSSNCATRASSTRYEVCTTLMSSWRLPGTLVGKCGLVAPFWDLAKQSLLHLSSHDPSS